MKEFIFNQQKMRQALDIFRKYSQEPRFIEDTKERKERQKFFSNFVGKKIDEFNFSEIIKKLWASQIWANQDYLVSEIIKNNGIDKISEEVSSLFSNSKTPAERYEHFRSNIKGMGPSMITEIICYADPKRAGIWNEKVRKALGWLEVRGVSYKKYQITGEEYDDFNKLSEQIASLLAKEEYKDADLLFVDYFLWEVWDNFIKDFKVKATITLEPKYDIELSNNAISIHDELKDKITAIGTWLGFEVEAEKKVADGAIVDVAWKARIANLGAVSYVFEVQSKGSIDSLILNLQRAQKNPTVQKLIVVSDIKQIEKTKNEIKDLPENFRRAVSFWEADSVDNTYENLEQVNDSIKKLNLIEE